MASKSERPWWLRLNGLPPGSGPLLTADEFAMLRQARRGRARWLCIPFSFLLLGGTLSRIDRPLRFVSDGLLIVWGVLLIRNYFGLSDKVSLAPVWQMRDRLRPQWADKRGELFIRRFLDPRHQGQFWMFMGCVGITFGLLLPRRAVPTRLPSTAAMVVACQHGSNADIDAHRTTGIANPITAGAVAQKLRDFDLNPAPWDGLAPSLPATECIYLPNGSARGAESLFYDSQGHLSRFPLSKLTH